MKKIEVVSIASRRTARTRELRDKILKELRQRKLYRPDLLYRGFSAEMINRVLSYGSENPKERFIYVNTEEYLNVEPDPQCINPLSYALSYGALAVYRGDRMKKNCFTCYEFMDSDKREALVVIFSFVH